jgi:hypothetical protein
MGGQGGSPEPGSCEALEEDFNDALAEARSCLAGGIVPTTECDDGISVVDLCGCPQAVSSEQTDARALIETARQAYADECVPPERCQLIDCAPKTSSGICQLTTHPNGVCVFQ